MNCRFSAVVCLSALILLPGPARAGEAQLELKKGDHITLIGNTLPDRMQHDGWLETLIQHRYPDLQLVFRNLAFPGDEVDLRPRSENFGSPEEWLTKTQTDIVFAFFGYNEAFAGEQGLPKFRERLKTFIDQTLAAKYSDRGSPRLVLFSPVAHEDLNDPNLPDGREHNVILEQYTQAMAEVAKEKGIPFVDLFHPSYELYAKETQPLTMNGVHLTPEGDRQISEVIVKSLFGGETKTDPKQLEKLRQAVIDKDFRWFNVYRAIDGYNIFGGRSKLAWFGQSNADVMQREMEIFTVQTANRDKKVWAAAQGKDFVVDDSNTPPEIPVQTNKPGPLPDGTYPFLGGEEAIQSMEIGKGLQVNLFASEEMFPDMIKPVQMAVDTDGRLWAATWPTYPHWNPNEPLADKLIILPDEDHDGKADKLIVFADGLNSITGFEFWGGGVLVAAAPEIIFLKDTDGDDRADVKIRMLQGISSEDSHHTANSLVIGPDGGLYSSHGVFHVDNMETPTKTFRSTRDGVYRFDPRTYEVSFHHPIGPNPHGIAFDQWGYMFASDGTSGTGSYVSIGNGVAPPKDWYQKRVRPVPATGFLSSSQFPKEFNGNFLICNSIGVLGVLQHRVEYDGADINAVEIEPILISSDPNFRPTDVEVAGDGALYISDWANPLIGHMQHNIRDPNRDHTHGRIYRVTHGGKFNDKPLKLKGKPIAEVAQAFYGEDNGTRYRARLELSGRKTDEVTAALSQWTAGIEPKTPADEQALLEALWTFEEHRVPNEELLKKVLQSKEPRVRAAAIRTLGHWGDKITSWAPVLLTAAREEEPLVRAEAVKAAINFSGPETAEVFYEVATRPLDVQLDYVLKYAKGQLHIDQQIQQAIASGKPLSSVAHQYALANANVNDLLKLEPSEAVYLAILARQNVPDAALRTALNGLAEMRKVSPVDLVLTLLTEKDAQKQESDLPVLTQLLLEQPTGDLQKVSSQLEKLATAGKTAAGARAGYAALILTDNGAHNALTLASTSKDAVRSVLEAIPLISNGEVRSATYEQVRPLLFELPGNLAQESAGSSTGDNGVRVDYFQPNGPNVAIETLNRMRPQASGIAPTFTLDIPERTQSEGYALRFTGSISIDKAGKYTFFTTSDDGSRLYIGDELVVNNDALQGPTEKSGVIDLPSGSHPITVTYFNGTGNYAFQVAWQGPDIPKEVIPADRLSVSGSSSLHDVAIRTLTFIPGHDAEKFDDLTALIKAGRNRTSAILALQGIPVESWKKAQLQPLADNLVAYLSEIPVKFRTGTNATTAMATAKSIADQLPEEQRQAILSRLENLDVRVIAVGTVPERMIYDKEKIIVQAGKPVEFVFSNSDNMPHNFAIVLPGSMEEIGLLAEKTAQDPDAMARNYIPKSDKVLLASRLLQPGQTQRISFEAPKKPGVYPYVCTYPGHWRRMYGALYVVDGSNTDADAAVASMTPQDELLKYLLRNTEWKYDDLAAQAGHVAMGHTPRSFEVGKQLFKVAACVSCHKLNGEGQQIGPDLTQLDPKRSLQDVLRDVLEPSLRINEKFASQMFALENGQILSGLVLSEDADEVKVVTNPLAPDKPTVIKKADIEERSVSKVSLMPQGVLNKLTEEEIFDLIAYVYAKGNKDHDLFKGHAGHHH
ncbi:PVC-type heme-binding CxxCH protein [Planctomicrobium sp. SH661]|uniref:PVC-type heme-binding CxxCH protein n=1 Tax=Planctomicrobium sp. SH661 TaxID=3448124 RepID=UPI003F5B4AEE